MNKIKKLSNDEVKLITIDARVAAIRWDLIPWCLLLDLDVSVSELKSAPMHRAWIVFEGVSDLNWPLLNTRLPNGCWLTSKITVKKITKEFCNYSFNGLFPNFEGDAIVGNPNQQITIKAMGMIGFCSTSSGVTENSILSMGTRINLGSDDEFLQMYEIERSNKI